MQLTGSSHRAKNLEPKKLALFFFIAFAWSWSWWSLFIFDVLPLPDGLGTSAIDIGSAGLSFIILLISPFGPTVSAFLITVITEGKAGVSALWERFRHGGFSVKWLAILLLFYPAYRLVVRYSSLVLGDIPQAPYEILNQPWLIFLPFLISILHGGLSEEFGWRGFALPRMQSSQNAALAAVILGFIEGCWHIPLVFWAGDERFGMSIISLILPYLAVGIFRAWIFNNTGGSILAAVLFHAAGNTAGDIVPINIPFPHFGDLMLYFIAVILVILFGPKDLVRKRVAGKGARHTIQQTQGT